MWKVGSFVHKKRLLHFKSLWRSMLLLWWSWVGFVSPQNPLKLFLGFSNPRIKLQLGKTGSNNRMPRYTSLFFTTTNSSLMLPSSQTINLFIPNNTLQYFTIRVKVAKQVHWKRFVLFKKKQDSRNHCWRNEILPWCFNCRDDIWKIKCALELKFWVASLFFFLFPSLESDQKQLNVSPGGPYM